MICGTYNHDRVQKHAMMMMCTNILVDTIKMKIRHGRMHAFKKETGAIARLHFQWAQKTQ